MVVMCAWFFDVALSAVLNAGRFDVGFYAGAHLRSRSGKLCARCHLVETTRLYGRLTVAASDSEIMLEIEQRVHDGRSSSGVRTRR